MDRIKGLREYVESRPFREGMGIPAGAPVFCRPLAQGEYNINYVFRHPKTGKKLVLRVNTGSQMHLERQIDYEYGALKLLEGSGRTPAPFYVDGSRERLDYGVMVMEFLEGISLDYGKDLEQAAECLADIHSVPVSRQNGLICPENPLQAIVDECGEMAEVYFHSELGTPGNKKEIEKMLLLGRKKAEDAKGYQGYRCCINTELNSGNFLMNGAGRPGYLVDWEKPLYGDPAQDLGHFLAPTTTFWKTDVILGQDQMEGFVKTYRKAVRERFDTKGLEERLRLFVSVTCLRGITWCAMAWVGYQKEERLIRNGDTFRKIEAYLEDGFLREIRKRYL